MLLADLYLVANTACVVYVATRKGWFADWPFWIPFTVYLAVVAAFALATWRAVNRLRDSFASRIARPS